MTGSLLAVDVGLRSGLACFDADGRLRWYRSKNFGRVDRLRRHVFRLYAEIPDLARVGLEGGGPLAEVWASAARRRGLEVVRVVAEEWREVFLPPRERTSGERAKRFADGKARRIIESSGAPRPTSLRHDAAEAILVGAYLLLRSGIDPAEPGARDP
jgi:hypothetical protein